VNILERLRERGLFKDATFTAAPEVTTAYVGFDLTAPSLHVGSLIPLMAMRWLAMSGHRVFALLGEATTRIGDPSGKDETRRMLGEDEIERNRQGIEAVIRRIVPDATIVSNGDWFNGVDPSFMSFLVDYGPHFTVNRMMAMDSVKRRLDRHQPLTFLEFSYSLLQAVDFREMHLRHGVDLQIGGSDQWGNIVSGVEVVRRRDGKEVMGLTTPLLLDREGNKMGKSQGRPVWLDAEMTPVFDFFQFWRNCADEDVERFYLMFTTVAKVSIDAMVRSRVAPLDINRVKKALAFDITEVVHGREAARAALAHAEAVFERGDTTKLTPSMTLTAPRSLVEVMVALGLAESKSAARRLIAGNAVSLDGEKISQDRLIDHDVVIRAGKKAPLMVEFAPETNQ
jgi:tyrosyl-tRNA synthetase